jgi:outer membrane protein TolC
MWFVLFCTQVWAAPLSHEALPKLLEKNGQYQEQVLLLDAIEAKKGVLRRSFIPRLEGRVGRERFTLGPGPTREQSYASLEARLNLFNGGKDHLANKQQGLATLSQTHEKETTQRQILTRVRSLWNAWVHHNSAVTIIQAALVQNAKHLSAAQKRQRAGLATIADELIFQQYALELEQELAREEEEVDDHAKMLQAVLNLNEIPTLPSTPKMIHLDELIERPFVADKHPETQQHSIKAQELALERMKQSRWWAPRLDVYGALTQYTDRQQFFERSQDRDDVAIGAMITIDLYDGGTALAERRAKVFETRAQGLLQEQRSRELVAEHEKSVVHVRLTHKLLEKAEASLKLAEKYLQVTLSEFQRGVKNSPDVREANHLVLTSQLNVAQTRWDHDEAQTHLMEFLGL